MYIKLCLAICIKKKKNKTKDFFKSSSRSDVIILKMSNSILLFAVIYVYIFYMENISGIIFFDFRVNNVSIGCQCISKPKSSEPRKHPIPSS